MPSNDKFEFRGINHLALVCRDMKKTVEFYTEVLGMPLTKTVVLPGPMAVNIFSLIVEEAISWPSSGSQRRQTLSQASLMRQTW